MEPWIIHDGTVRFRVHGLVRRPRPTERGLGMRLATQMTWVYTWNVFIRQLICKRRCTVFMLIERMIQLPQKNSIPGIVGILLERKLLPVIIFYESN